VPVGEKIIFRSAFTADLYGFITAFIVLKKVDNTGFTMKAFVVEHDNYFSGGYFAMPPESGF
jgi:hypothetical protein